jgi:hypothetical protein
MSKLPTIKKLLKEAYTTQFEDYRQDFGQYMLSVAKVPGKPNSAKIALLNKSTQDLVKPGDPIFKNARKVTDSPSVMFSLHTFVDENPTLCSWDDVEEAELEISRTVNRMDH